MKVTLKDIAQMAGVSMATASLALKGADSVADKTRKKILRLAKQYNYMPNLMARSLAGGHSNIIGVLIDSCAPQIIFEMLSLIEKEASAHGYRLMIGESHNNIDNLREIYNVFTQYNVEGILCLAHDYPDQEEDCATFFKQCDNTIFWGKPKFNGVSYVNVDRSQAIYDAVRHLLDQGYQRICLVGSSLNYSSVLDRIAAFTQVCDKFGLVNSQRTVYRAPSQDNCSLPPFEELYKGMEDLYRIKVLEEKCDAFLMENDFTAAAFCKVLLNSGMDVPSDVGVIGSDNSSLCDFSTPEISSFNDLPASSAKYLINMLLENTNDHSKNHVNRCMSVFSSLVIRNSSLRRSK